MVLFQNLVALLFRQNIEAAQQRQAGIDQRRQLPRENHQHLRLNFCALEKNDAAFRAWLASCRAIFAVRCRAALPSDRRFAFFINAGREIPSLAQLADRFIGRIGFNQAGRFLAAGIEGDVIETGHGERF